MPETIKDSLLELPFFDRFDAQELDVLSKRLVLKPYTKGQHVFREGEQGTFMGFVLSGSLVVVKGAGKGAENPLTAIKKGFTFGEMALIDHYARSASIAAREASELLILSRDTLDALCEQHPRIALKILQGVSRLLSLNLRRTSGVLCDYLGD